MGTGLSTTPFGRRPLSLAMLASDMVARQCPPDASVNKWQLFRAVCEAKSAIGCTDRSLAVLNALLTFYPDTDLTGEGELIVFPSNAQLALRAHGMAPATLRRHLAVLVECGLLVRRDSPNGKRYARKGEGGSITEAFGFDLTPLLARAAEFEEIAEAARAERRALQLCRERITLMRRDIAKMITFGMEEGIKADWEGMHRTYRDILGRIPRTATSGELAPLEAELHEIADEIRNVLENHVKSENMNANESQNERHIHNSNTQLSEFEPRFRKDEGATAEPRQEPKSTAPTGYPLGMVLRACPDIADYATQGISDWRELVETANLVRGALGVSPDAWHQACEAMGATDAAIVIAGILQRSDQITSAGGYLRALTDKARAGEFSVGPMLMALLKARNRSDAAKAG